MKSRCEYQVTQRYNVMTQFIRYHPLSERSTLIAITERIITGHNVQCISIDMVLEDRESKSNNSPIICYIAA